MGRVGLFSTASLKILSITLTCIYLGHNLLAQIFFQSTKEAGKYDIFFSVCQVKKIESITKELIDSTSRIRSMSHKGNVPQSVLSKMTG